VAGSCEEGNEPSVSIKFREFLDYLKPVTFSRRMPIQGIKATTTGHIKALIRACNPGKTNLVATLFFHP